MSEPLDTSTPPAREYDRKGLYLEGPRFVSASDVLARVIGDTLHVEPAPTPTVARAQTWLRAKHARRKQREFAAFLELVSQRRERQHQGERPA